jgi:chaperonin GroEL
MQRSHTKRVVFQPKTNKAIQTGVNTLGRAIRPTLGPLARNVLIAKTADRSSFPELMDNGGLIARRVIALTDRDEDMGAMFFRQALWRQYNDCGDGAATMAVMFLSIYNQAMKYIADGGNAMVLSRNFQNGMRVIYSEIERMIKPVTGREMLAHIAETICYDPELSEMLSEIFDIVGEYGQVDIRSGPSRDLERQYIEGMMIDRGLQSVVLIRDSIRKRTDLVDASILLSDFDYKEASEIIPIIQDAYSSGVHGLMIVCKSISEKAISVLTAANRNPEKFTAIAVNCPIEVNAQAVWLQDIGILTGARPFLKAFGDRPETVTLSGLGQARRVWADMEHFGIIGGKGEPIEVHKHIHALKHHYETCEDQDQCKQTLERIGKLLGGSATLMVGGITELEINQKKEVAERTVQAIRETMKSGYLPGGGVTYLNCRPVVKEMIAKAADMDERKAYKILLRALEEPARVILENAGFDPSEVMPVLNRAEAGMGYDVRTREIVDFESVGIIDSANVLLSAFRQAISSAALALSVDVLVHKKNPATAVNP